MHVCLCVGLLGDGTTMPSIVTALKPPVDPQLRSKWLAGSSLTRTLQLVSAVLRHCEVRGCKHRYTHARTYTHTVQPAL